MRTAMLSLLFGSILIISGCSSLGVKAWERNLLARNDMLMDADAVDLALDELREIDSDFEM